VCKELKVPKETLASKDLLAVLDLVDHWALKDLQVHLGNLEIMDNQAHKVRLVQSVREVVWALPVSLGQQVTQEQLVAQGHRAQQEHLAHLDNHQQVQPDSQVQQVSRVLPDHKVRRVPKVQLAQQDHRVHKAQQDQQDLLVQMDNRDQ